MSGVARPVNLSTIEREMARLERIAEVMIADTLEA